MDDVLANGACIFIRSYDKDLPWLEYCLESIQVHCHDFTDFVLVVPAQQLNLFSKKIRPPWHLYVAVERSGNGYHEQQITKLRADAYTGCEYILFVDSDCIFHTPNSPRTYLTDSDAVQLLVRPWDKADTAICWRASTEKALGWQTPYETMCRLPMMHRRSAIIGCRRHVEEQQHMPIADYIRREGTFSEFNVLGNWVYRQMDEGYRIIDATIGPQPPQVAKQFWSHAGIKPETAREIHALIRGPHKPA